jgi:hypothetical protein
MKKYRKISKTDGERESVCTCMRVKKREIERDIERERERVLI